MHADAGPPASTPAAPPPLPDQGYSEIRPALAVGGGGKWWIWLIVIACIAGIVVYAWKAGHNTAAGAGQRGGMGNKATPVVAATATEGDVPIYLKGLGAVTPFNVVTVRSRVDGEIMKLTFKEGQTVHQGDLLAEIDPRPFQVQLTQAQGQMEKDQASLKNATMNVQRDREAKDAIAAQQLDTDIAAAAQLDGSVKIDQGQIDSANLQLTYCHITSPITGRVGLQLVNVGNIVHASDQTGLAVITQLQPIAVEFSLPEDNIFQIMGTGDSVPPLPVEIFDRDDARRITSGQLLAIDSQIDPNTGMVKLKAKFDNSDNALFPSQFVNVHLLVDTKKDVVIVPTAAVQRGPDFTFLYVVKAGGSPAPAKGNSGGHDRPEQTVEVRKVTLGPSQGDDTSITTGLAAGEVVVVNGVDKLEDQSKVTVRMAAGPTTAPAGDGAGSKKGPTTRRHKSQ